MKKIYKLIPKYSIVPLAVLLVDEYGGVAALAVVALAVPAFKCYEL